MTLCEREPTARRDQTGAVELAVPLAASVRWWITIPVAIAAITAGVVAALVMPDPAATAEASVSPQEAPAAIAPPRPADEISEPTSSGDPPAQLRDATSPDPAAAAPVASRDALPVSAAALRERGRELDRAGKWDDARAIYHKLERFKSYAHEALYRQAWDAYQANDPMAAMQLARRVAFHAGPYVLPARFLYGDSLVRLGDCAGAKRFYLALRRKLRGEDRATATRKITLCNQMLKLAVADGMETSDDR